MPRTLEERVDQLEDAVEELEAVVKRALDRLRLIESRRDDSSPRAKR